jgi:phosphoribosyl-ATP pyrophosphohydrolase/phosphoribosyl-AMP cyclohydrolase
MNELDLDWNKLDWNKGGGLLPAIVQDARSGAVLMLGYMDAEALARTQQGGKVTFYSRSKRRLWTKGETTGNHLLLKSVRADCDSDALLIQAEPIGPTCHQGTRSCFGNGSEPGLGFLAVLDALVAQRARELPGGSYITALFERGVRRIAQKVGEEGVETALAATTGDDAELLDEAADLLFHLIVLLRARGKSLSEVVDRLRSRHGAPATA